MFIIEYSTRQWNGPRDRDVQPQLWCPYVRVAKKIVDRHQITCREILINQVPSAKEQVIGWAGFQSIPTIIVANEGQDLPVKAPAPLAPGTSPRGVNRGTMITEPSDQQLIEWLRQHGFIDYWIHNR